MRPSTTRLGCGEPLRKSCGFRLAVDFDAEVGPGEGGKFAPRFIDGGPDTAEFFPAIVRRGDVLDGVIAAGLIGGDGIARADVEDFGARRILADAEGDADEAGTAAAGRLNGIGGQVDVDGAIAKICASDGYKSVAVGHVAGKANGFAAQVFGGCGFDSVLVSVTPNACTN